jgi:hypothetical protein
MYNWLPSWSSVLHCRITRDLHWSLSWGHINPVSTTLSYIRHILILSTHPCLGLPRDRFVSSFSVNILHNSSSPFRATCPVYLIFRQFIILIILHGECKLWDSSLCL